MSVTGFNKRRRAIQGSESLGGQTEKVNNQGHETETQSTQEKEIEPHTEKTVAELREQAKEKGITGYTRMKKDELIKAIGDD